MAHNNRIRLSGTWTTGSVITPAEMEALDAAQYAAIHEGGGTWAPASLIILGGAGMRVTGPLTADDLDGHVTAGKTLGIDVNATLSVNGVVDVLLGGVQKIQAGGLVRVLGAPGYPGKIKLEANSEITIEAFAKGKIQPDGTLYTYGLQKVETGPGASSGGKVWITNGGSIDIDEPAGFFLRSTAVASIEGQIDVKSGGSVMVRNGARLDVQGILSVANGGFAYVGKNGSIESPGHVVIDADGTAAGSDVVLRNGARLTATLSSFIDANGTGSRLQALNGASIYADNNSSIVTGGAAVLMSGNTGSLTLGRGDYNVSADIKRTGADIPSGNGAYSAQRPADTGPATSATITSENYDRLRIPTLSAACTWTLSDPPKPMRLVIYSRDLASSPSGANLFVRDSGGTDLVSFTGGSTLDGSATLGWTGNRWIVESIYGAVFGI